LVNRKPQFEEVKENSRGTLQIGKRNPLGSNIKNKQVNLARRRKPLSCDVWCSIRRTFQKRRSKHLSSSIVLTEILWTGF
jgi:hypothetical protein